MMHYTVALFILMFGVPAAAQQRDTTAMDNPLQAYGYVALAVVVLAAIVVVLIRKQYRKFNE